MKIQMSIFLWFTGTLLMACSGKSAHSTPPIVGNDRDAHGCIASAGYQWCQSTQRCERSWELAQSRGFENSAEAFKGFCK